MQKPHIVRVAVLSACLLACAAYLERATTFEPVPIRRPLAQLPMQMNGWEGTAGADFDKEVLSVLGVDEYINRVYRPQAGPAIGLYVGYYRSQRTGDTMHSPMNCLPGSGWLPVKSGRAIVQLPQASEALRDPATPSTIEINRYVVQKSGESMLVFYWYQSHGRVVANEYWSKIYTVLDAIRLNRTDAALVRVVVPIPESEGKTEQQMEQLGVDFVRTLMPLLGHHLPV
jgi:EpsI family protein